MNFRSFKILTDENVDVELLDFLRAEGFDVFDIKEECLFRLSDAAILELSVIHERVVISQDSDFGTLIFRDNAPFFGVVYLRPGHQLPGVHIETVESILKAGLDFEAPFVLVAENSGGFVKIRLRNP